MMAGTDVKQRWTTARACVATYMVPPLAVPIMLAIALAAFSYALN